MNHFKGYSPAGKVVVFVPRLTEEFARRDDGSVSTIRQEAKFDNHWKGVTEGIVAVGTDVGGGEIVDDADHIMPRSAYNPTGYLTSSIFRPSIKPGDRVWFHYLCSENREQMHVTSDGYFLGMDANDVFCVLPGDDKNAKLVWNHAYCAGDPVVEDDRKAVLLDANGAEIKAKVMPWQGVPLVVGLLAPPMVDQCRIWGMSPSLYKDVSAEVSEGDHVYLAKDSEFVNYILDHKTWVFKHSDIIGIVSKDVSKTKPVGDYHLVRVPLNDYTLETKRKIVKDELTGFNATLVNKTPIVVTPNRGTVIASGSRARSAEPGEMILFTKRWTKMLDREYWLVHNGEIQAKVNG
jgi:hypothetical protein